MGIWWYSGYIWAFHAVNGEIARIQGIIVIFLGASPRPNPCFIQISSERNIILDSKFYEYSVLERQNFLRGFAPEPPLTLLDHTFFSWFRHVEFFLHVHVEFFLHVHVEKKRTCRALKKIIKI